MKTSKRIIFTVTTGRSGTMYLSHLLSDLPGIRAEHEPAPFYHALLPEARRNPEIARKFLIEEKMPFIESLSEHTYVEASHYMAKGFMDPLLEMGVVPDLILLRRDARKVASSFFLIGVADQKKRLLSFRKKSSDEFKKHMISPDEPNFLPAQGWQDWHEYQLYYWYVLETYFRGLHYAKIVGERGGNIFETSLETLTSGADCESLLTWAGVPQTLAHSRAQDGEYLRRVLNDKSKSKRKKGRDSELAGLDLDALEAQVRLNCGLDQKINYGVLRG